MVPIMIPSLLLAASLSLGAQAPDHQPAPAEHGGGHGPAIKLFGMELNDGGKWGIQLLNFAIFAGALGFIAKGPLTSAFAARAKEIADRLKQAEVDKAEGEAQIRELEAKMSAMEAELASIMAKAESEAEAEKQRVLEAAKSEAGALVAQAQAEIESQRRLAERELRALVADLAVAAAATRLQANMQGDAAGLTVDRAIAQIGGAK